MKCPLNGLCECEPECSLLISDEQGCAICGLIYQPMMHNNEGAVINAVNFTMRDSLAELVETHHDMSGSDMPAWECSICGYDENTCNACYCGRCGRKFKCK